MEGADSYIITGVIQSVSRTEIEFLSVVGRERFWGVVALEGENAAGRGW